MGLWLTRASLLRDIDDRINDSAQSIGTLYSRFPAELEEFVDDSEGLRAVILVDPDGVIVFDRPAGRGTGQLGRPDISADEILSRPGETFTVGAEPAGEESPRFRVAVRVLDNGEHLLIGESLDELGGALRTMARSLLGTLFGVISVLGVMFWWLARLTLEPYDQIVETADAIVDGDLDRRVASDQPDPSVRRLVGSINRMLDQNQESLAARTEAESRVTRFAAEASHELRTPLATIAGYSEVYLSGASTDRESVEKQMTRINGEATRLGRLVESMLTLTRLDNEVDIEEQRVDVVELVRDAIGDTALGSPESDLQVELSFTLGDDGAVLVDGDRDALFQVLSNLLSNAVVHAPGAGIVVAATSERDHVTVTVTDDGPGMAPDVASSAFERFYRGSPTSESGLRTTGLGLSIAAGIIQAHHGTIELETAPGEGAAFTLRLPRATA